MVDADLKEELRDTVRTHAARGMSDFDGVVEAAVEYLDTFEGDERDLEEAAREVAVEEFAAHAEAQAAWGDGPLEPDRLRAAFRSLDEAGIIARADFTCCQNCGVHEIGAEVPEGATARGYAFCHRQDVEGALHGGGVYLSYGVFDGKGNPADIAAEVVDVLGRHGFAPEWNGDAGKRVFVPMTWRVRRHGRLAAYPGRQEPEAPVLKVSIQDLARRTWQEDWPMTFAEVRAALLDLPPADGSFFVCVSASDQAVQGMWQDGGRLWAEHPDPAERVSLGRFVTVEEAIGMLRALAEEDRVTLTELGPVEREAWPES
ncbi:DUF6891 domain-containing protein [Actinomadura rupiterrae]|uniref:DUF6891 domain-containing protein n=1 Tax=Actinomadura rupiterrae TaxID=559627 RepID=UPI0020A467FB|nr:hypothetical protein [Actinomadura rupiterrae]MCP2337864.1 hypothetical protein [Actinomadura rupiterrae]